jgi:hypothetical protein
MPLAHIVRQQTHDHAARGTRVPRAAVEADQHRLATEFKPDATVAACVALRVFKGDLAIVPIARRHNQPAAWERNLGNRFH